MDRANRNHGGTLGNNFPEPWWPGQVTVSQPASGALTCPYHLVQGRGSHLTLTTAVAAVDKPAPSRVTTTDFMPALWYV